jgi:hypothetical protein
VVRGLITFATEMGKEKRSKKDKKHKKESKKSSKKSSKRRKHDRQRDDSTKPKYSDFGLLLSYGLIVFPSLNTDLPEMLVSLDRGEYVNISAIRNIEMREYLLELFQMFPVESQRTNGFCKLKACKSIRKELINRMLECKDVIHPQAMDSAQASSVRAAPKLQSLLSKFPELTAQLPAIFSMIHGGEAVDLGGMANEEVRDGLLSFLKAIGTTESPANEFSLGLPNKSQESVRQALKYFESLLEAISKRKAKADAAAQKSAAAGSALRPPSSGGDVEAKEPTTSSSEDSESPSSEDDNE